MKTFLTPLQYNEIFSASTNIVINGSVNEEKSYLLDKCKSLEAKNGELEKKLETAVEALEEIKGYGYKPNDKESVEAWNFAEEALSKIKSEGL